MIQQNKLQAKWNDELAKQRLAEAQIDFLNNLQVPYMLNYYDRIYKEPIKLARTHDYCRTLNLSEQLVGKLAIAFKNGLDYNLTTNGGDNPEQEEERKQDLIDICNKAQLLPTLSEADEYVTMNNYAAISAVWDYSTGEVRLDLIPRSTCFVTQDVFNPKRITAFYYQIGITEDSPQRPDSICEYMKITADSYDTVTVDHSNGSEVLHETTPNPYGVITVVGLFSELQVNSYFPDKKSLIMDFNIDVNTELTNYALTHTMQSHSILVITGDTGSKLSATQVTAIKVNPYPESDKADVKYVTPGADLAKLLKTINDKCLMYANMLGISASVYSNTQAGNTTAFEIAMSVSGITEKINERLPFYSRAVNTLVNLIAQIYSYHNSTATFDRYSINVEINQHKIEPSRAEILDNYSKELALGLVSKVEILMKERKMSREDAEELYATIKADEQVGVVEAFPNLTDDEE